MLPCFHHDNREHLALAIKIELTGIYEPRQNSQIDLTNNLLGIYMKQCKKWLAVV